MDLENAKKLPKVFYAKHMQAGVCEYNSERILIENDAIQRMMPTFNGRPVYVQHQKVDLPNLQQKADGYISDSFYNELDGWYWVKFIAVSDAAHEAIRKGWAVSNAYVPTHDDMRRGTWHNVPYARQILNGEFTHLAIVNNPRYEGACILSPDEFKSYQAEKKQKLNELTNNKEPKPMFKRFFQNTKSDVSPDKVTAETMVELQDGTEVSVGEMTNAVTEARKAELANKKNEKEETADEKMNSEIEVGDEKMLLKDLISAYTNMKKNEKKNESEEDKKEEEKEKENALTPAEKKELEELRNQKKARDIAAAEALVREKQNGKKSFEELKNAHFATIKAAPKVEISADKVSRGKQRYGSN